MATIIKTVEKDELQTLIFPKSDVLFSNIEKDKRKILLEQACRIGNDGIRASKTGIIFSCSEGMRKVEARIISLSKDTVILKGVSSLPIKSIIGVKVT